MGRTGGAVGQHRLQWHDIDLRGSAAGAMAFLERASVAWIQGCAGLTDADLEPCGGPTGSSSPPAPKSSSSGPSPDQAERPPAGQL
ncbi:MAG TPA: hypothetical protein VNT52_06105, partial [Acidimicrobiales bacterium]|nr:hypothetical protein [Acidimicrobiales bacterium]